jgi:hypothetical protein
MSIKRYDTQGRVILAGLKFDKMTIVGDEFSRDEVSIPTWILEHKEISALGKILFSFMKGAIQGHFKMDSASVRTFARLIDVDERTVQRKLRELEDAGAITVQKSFLTNKQQTNIYYLWPYKPDLGVTDLSPVTNLSQFDDTDVTPNININNNNNIVSPKVEVKKTRKTKVYTPEFEALWLLYPRKENKPGAFEAYNGRIRDDKVPYETLMQAVKNYALKRKNENPMYTLHPKTFFGPGRRYEDYLGKQDDVFPLTPEQIVVAEIYEDWDKLKTWINPVDGEVILDNPVKMNYSRPTNEIGQPIDINGRPYKLDNQGRRHSLEFTTY